MVGAEASEGSSEPEGPARSGQEPAAGSATFEELMAELEDVTARLAAGDLGIEAATDLYERAERLHALATERLERVKARVEGLGRSSGTGDSSPSGG